MFLDFWNLREQPFGVTPDPRYLYFSPGHREALATLFCGIETARGFLSLVGQPGMGKTTLLFQLLKRWKGFVSSAYLFQTQCDSPDFIRYLLGDLGLKNNTRDVVRMHSELFDFLLNEQKASRRVVVLVDEAQNLTDSVLETVRLLSNFEATDRKLLQIVLAGQPELATKLSSPRLAQLRQRIAVHARLDPLDPPEVARYVAHRLQVAGYQGEGVFAPSASELIAELSEGIPRLINVLCFNSMSLGFAMKRRLIDREIVREAARDSSYEVIERVTGPNGVPSRPRESSPRARSEVGSTLRPATLLAARQGPKHRQHILSAALLGLSLSIAVYLGAHGWSVSARPSMPPQKGSAPAAASSKLGAAEPFQTVGSPTGIVEQEVGSVDKEGVEKTEPSSFVYVVQPRDTIHAICLSNFGHYDRGIVSEIQSLNSSLKNPNILAVGQELRLPRRSHKQDSHENLPK